MSAAIEQSILRHLPALEGLRGDKIVKRHAG